MLSKTDIKLVRSLGDKNGRQAEGGLFVAEGEKLVAELLASNFVVRRLFRVGDNVSASEMARLSFLRTPTPVLAVAEIPHHPLDDPNTRVPGGLCLMLDDVQDPGNVGTIIRLADWFGVRDIYCTPATAECWNPKVVQATMGAILRVRVHYRPAEALNAFLLCARQANIPVYGTFLEGDNIYRCDLGPNNGIIVMGNEGRGISPEIGALVTHRLFIPPGPVFAASGGDPSSSESLNVATATAITLSEFHRRLF